MYKHYIVAIIIVLTLMGCRETWEELNKSIPESKEKGVFISDLSDRIDIEYDSMAILHNAKIWIEKRYIHERYLGFPFKTEDEGICNLNIVLDTTIENLLILYDSAQYYDSYFLPQRKMAEYPHDTVEVEYYLKQAGFDLKRGAKFKVYW